MRKALTLTLALSFAAFGCSMNRNPGNGQPVTNQPYQAPAPTPVISSGAAADGGGAIANVGAFVVPGGASAAATTGTSIGATGGAITGAATIGTTGATRVTGPTATALNVAPGALTPTMSSGQ